MADNALSTAALSYAQRGWAVVPLHTPSNEGGCSCGDPQCDDQGKHPRIKEWEKRATTDEATIRQWWQRWPNANVGIHCGMSGLVVIDIDPRNGGDGTWRTLRAMYGLDDDTVTDLTGGGGTHLLYSANGADPTTLKGKLGPGVDVKRGNGLIVVPPSLHVSGHRYDWEASGHPDDMDPLPLHPSLLHLLRRGGGGERPRAASPVGDKIQEGERNSTLASIAGTMRRRGMSEAAILAALQEENAGKCAPPLPSEEVARIARSIARYEPHAEPTTFNLTDLGNARRLVAQHGADLRYCHPWKRWLVWDGTRWAADDTAEVVRRAKDTVAAIYAEASRVPDEEGRKAIARHAMKSESAHRLKAMLALAESEDSIPILPEQMDRDPWRLNVLNGTLDLRSGELLPHQAGDLITKLAPVSYDAHAPCPLWDAFLERIMDGNTELIRFLRRAIGYSLTGDTSEQCLFILYGTGANGKSTLLQTISAMLGDYAQQTPVGTLMMKRGRTIPNDIARLRGARFVTAAEAEEGQRLAESLVKQMTGNDKLAARFLHAEFFEFTPTFKVFLATNHKPTIRGTDHAIWRRIRLIPFMVTIMEAEQDKELATKLLAELDGILAWAVRGCLDWQRDGLGTPAEVQRATEAYRGEMDVLGGFLDDCCTIAEGVETRASVLYQAYRDWCEENGERAISGTRFGRRLTERGFDKVKVGHVYYLGIGLLAEGAAAGAEIPL